MPWACKDCSSAPASRRKGICTPTVRYQPGETVKLRGIIRDVKDGAYGEGKAYLVSVTDAAGRLIWEAEQALGTFGTFHAQLRLDPRARRIHAHCARKGKPQTGLFQRVCRAKFQLEKSG